jgi:LysM repeat protein
MARVRYLFAMSTLLTLLVAVGPAAATPLRQSPEPIVHVVQPGENLFRISLRYNTTVAAIMSANGILDADSIYAGQELIIPTGSGAQAPAEPPAPAEPVPVDEAGYVVQWGDTLSAIAARHGIPLWTLVEANGLSQPYVIYAGQRLIIPSVTAHTLEPEPEPNSEPTPSPSPAVPETYTVQPGDTLTQIARRFGTTALELARLNGIANPSTIYAGQVLHLTGAGPAAAGGSKRILVDISEQHLYAYHGDQLVFSFIASTGMAPTYTRTGEFHVQSKIPNAYGATWDIWMPHWLGIYWAGGSENGIHALPILSNGQTLWAGYLGTPISYGCVVLGTYEAASLYEWAELGTAVTIQP